jgi:hypothetical protein
MSKYICPTCNKIFRDNEALNKHLKAKNPRGHNKSVNNVIKDLEIDDKINNEIVINNINDLQNKLEILTQNLKENEFDEEYLDELNEKIEIISKLIDIQAQQPGKKKFKLFGLDFFMLYDISDSDLVESMALNMIVDQAGKPRIIDRKGRGFHTHLVKKSNESNVIDHIDGNSMNNRRENLREITTTQNNYNRQPKTEGKYDYPGVKFMSLKTIDYWRASITSNGKEVSEKFNSKKEAVTWRFNKHIELYGEFNFEKRTLEEILFQTRCE